MVQVFITEFIKNIYLGQVMYSIHTNIDAATKGKARRLPQRRVRAALPRRLRSSVALCPMRPSWWVGFLATSFVPCGSLTRTSESFVAVKITVAPPSGSPVVS